MSDIQDLKHRRGAGDCDEQIVNERKISDTLERELNEWLSLQVWGETPALVCEFISAQQSRIKATQGIERELDAARVALREAIEAETMPALFYDRITRWRKAAGLEGA